MKKYLKIGAFLLALVLIGGLLFYANAFVGNPVSQILAENAAKKYLQERYAGRDYYIEDVRYNFKTGDYYARVKSEHSVDTHFSISVSMAGRVLSDSYASYVTSGFNTYTRLCDEYRKLTDQVFDAPDYPYASDIAFGDLVFDDTREIEQMRAEEYRFCWNTGDLELDKTYDIRAVGQEIGKLIVYVQDDNVTPERAAEILLGMRERFDDAGIPFRVIEFVLQHPKTEGGRQEGEVRSCLLYEEIYEEGLADRVRESNRKIEAYYAEMDAQKNNWLDCKFVATVIEVHENSVLLEPVEGEPELRSSDRISMSTSQLANIGAQVGSTVEVTYTGEIMESYPAQIIATDWKLIQE